MPVIRGEVLNTRGQKGLTENVNLSNPRGWWESYEDTWREVVWAEGRAGTKDLNWDRVWSIQRTERPLAYWNQKEKIESSRKWNWRENRKSRLDMVLWAVEWFRKAWKELAQGSPGSDLGWPWEPYGDWSVSSGKAGTLEGRSRLRVAAAIRERSHWGSWISRDESRSRGVWYFLLMWKFSCIANLGGWHLSSLQPCVHTGGPH